MVFPSSVFFMLYPKLRIKLGGWKRHDVHKSLGFFSLITSQGGNTAQARCFKVEKETMRRNNNKLLETTTIDV